MPALLCWQGQVQIEDFCEDMLQGILSMVEWQRLAEALPPEISI